jgi:hypothetical protein
MSSSISAHTTSAETLSRAFVPLAIHSRTFQKVEGEGCLDNSAMGDEIIQSPGLEGRKRNDDADLSGCARPIETSERGRA